MSTALDGFHVARRRLVLAAVDLLAAEMRLGDLAASASAVTKADATLALAARDLTRATDQLPRERQPKGWAA